MDKRFWMVFFLGVCTTLVLGAWYILSQFFSSRIGKGKCDQCGGPLGFLLYCKHCDKLLLMIGILLAVTTGGVVFWMVTI